MKKRIVIGISVLIGITLIISTFILKKKDNNYQRYNNSGSHLAFYYQDDNGEYVQSTDFKWIEGNYILNVSESICNGTKNPSFLSWNENDRTVILSNGISTSCTLYFDKQLPGIFQKCSGASNLIECITRIDGGETGEETLTSEICPDGIGTIIKHDGTVAGDDGTVLDAEDNGFRYSGCNPNNYVCFGNGSESYNNGESPTCPLENKYRIIGYVPVTIDGNEEFRVKLIKAEYLTEEEYKTKVGTPEAGYHPGESVHYERPKRIEGDKYDIDGFYYSDLSGNQDNREIRYWGNTLLYTELNSDTYLDKTYGFTWQNKIEKVTWTTGSDNDFGYVLNAKGFYKMEKQGKETLGLIGLMYPSDYGYAADKSLWSVRIATSEELYLHEENDWLYNDVEEATIWVDENPTNGSKDLKGIMNIGRIDSMSSNIVLGIRPVFYLKSDVEIVGGNNSDGSVSNPFKIKMPPKTMIEKLIDSDKDTGNLLHHISTLNQGIKDNSYRYVGSNPNNYICFGDGSEAYNRGQENSCPLKNKYRIIGYVPVTLADGKTQTSLIKVIKAEYLTPNEFIDQDGTSSFNTTYKNLKRVETTENTIPGYKWSTNGGNTWESSSLYEALNSDYINKSLGSIWEDKIKEVTWNVGGASTNRMTTNAMYQAEMTGDGAKTTKSSLIGLMYAHDYGYATINNNWGSTLYGYDNKSNTNRENNWLYNANYEWSISRYSSDSNSAFIVQATGNMNYGNTKSTAYGVRPAFYLKEDVNINDSDADGSREKPFRIAINSNSP